MRLALIALLAVCACGKKSPQQGDGSAAGSDGSAVGSDAPSIDASTLPVCAGTVIAGSTVSAVSIGSVGTTVGAAVVTTSPPDDDRLFVVAQLGQIRIFDATRTLLPAPFLDLKTTITCCGEMGLLGLAFHPQYAQNHFFYVWYTATNPNTADTGHPLVDVLARYTANTADPNTADATSGLILLSIPDPFPNHNGGMLEFGADGFLYVGTGDGGGTGDPQKNAQNPNALLGKMLRLDVDHPGATTKYGIPADNPFANGGGAPEIFMIGLRNPWRWSFDRGTGDMWIADVGQALVEEVDVLRAGQQNGKNLGWNIFEGNMCFANQPACVTTLGTFVPQFTHAHTDAWAAIIGGQVYRGGCFPDLVGMYFFSDENAGPLVRAHLEADGSLTTVELPPPAGGWPKAPAAIHADARGELYETTVHGEVFHLVAGP